MTDFTVSMVILVVLLVAIVAVGGAATHANEVRWERKTTRTVYFASRYGASVDRMLEESPANREQLRAIRDSGRDGVPKAVLELRRSEPVPLEAAAEFIRRL